MSSPTGERTEGKLRIFLTGGTGFVGGRVAGALAEHGHKIRALVRDRESSQAGQLRELGADLVLGDVSRGQTLSGAIKGCDVVIHLVGIIKERSPHQTYERVHTRGTIHVVEAAKSAGVKKFIHMSALGARADGTAYQRTKFEGEEAARRSGIPFVIFRPSVIVGHGGEFTRMLLRVIRLLPITPVIGDGRYRLQPVDVRDVAEAFVLAAEREELSDVTYDIAGPHKLTYNRIIEIVCEELGYKRQRFHIPLRTIRPLVEIASNWRLPAPINSEQLAMLLEENVVRGEENALRDVFGLEPRSLRSLLRELKK